MHFPATTPTKPCLERKHNDIPDHLPARLPALTTDFYPDTHFNPVWMSGPYVFSFAEDGTVVRPETHSLEPYPGYYIHAGRSRRLESVNASCFQGFSRSDEKPWKNVAITEQDDAESAAIQAGVGGERGRCAHEDAQWSIPDGEERELVYAWPPMPMDGDGKH